MIDYRTDPPIMLRAGQFGFHFDGERLRIRSLHNQAKQTGSWTDMKRRAQQRRAYARRRYEKAKGRGLVILDPSDR